MSEPVRIVLYILLALVVAFVAIELIEAIDNES